MASNTPRGKGIHSSTPQPDICDYEGSFYRTDFWTHERAYEDAVERVALKALLPSVGRRLIDIGAGFGRLVDLYAGYEQVVLFDYSRSLLKEARDRWGDAASIGRPRFTYVAGDFYALPFACGLFDAVTMVRVIHHAEDARLVLQGISEIIAPDGIFVLEFASKRHLKAIARWALRQQNWNPFDISPIEFAELNFNFHPYWIQAQLEQSGFIIKTQRSVSHFRLGLLKRLIPTRHLVKLDSLMQPTGEWWQLTPSVFIKSQAPDSKTGAEAGMFFRCPVCRSTEVVEQANGLLCQDCQRLWPIRDGLYDFKEPL
jgi:ubiquinone/menaquinone biosynthesis C-methylase UbiE